jgi:DmsE family decaheme c-type cytochrome
MFSSVISQCTGWSARFIVRTCGLALLIAGLAASPNVAQAYDYGPDFVALSDYVKSIEGGRPHLVRADGSSQNSVQPASTNSAHHELGDPAYAALRTFAERIAGEQPEPAAAASGRTQLAQADNALDALREWFSRGGAPAASAPKTNGPVAGGTVRSEPPPGATSVGSQVCATCHASSAEQYNRTLMGKLTRTPKGAGLTCEGCHGPGSAHVKAGGGRGVAIISFRPDDVSRTAEQNNEFCLACHTKGSHTLWQGSTHDERGLMCTNCHTVMKNVSRKGQMKTAWQPDTCAQCHQKQRSEMWRTSHMPTRTPSLGREGKIVCSDCHNPHGSYSEKQLKKATINEVCWTCHAEKRGPYLWEHQPVTENCVNCHEPHGSNNDGMLKISRPRLCQQCHTGHASSPQNPNIALYAQGRACQHCHSAHHGSNNPAGARFMR